MNTIKQILRIAFTPLRREPDPQEQDWARPGNTEIMFTRVMLLTVITALALFAMGEITVLCKAFNN